MSKPRKDRSSDKKIRVKVAKIAGKDRELKHTEAENIRGGGGASGGVPGDRNSKTNSQPA